MRLRDIIASMTQQFARIPSDAGAVVREVRGFGGVPWGRLFGYLRPQWRPFAIALVDNESARLVQEALDRLKVGRTTIIVARRLSTIRAADRIAVLDEGRLVELGTQEDLLVRDGLYARLHRTQLSEPVEPVEAVEV